MKKLLMVFLLLIALPALAEDDPAAALDALYKEAALHSSAMEGDFAFYALDMPGDSPDKLVGFTRQDGAWTLTLDSDTALRPSGLADSWRRYPYDWIDLTLKDGVLSIRYQFSSMTWWRYDFAWQDGAWQFLRLYSADEGNRTYDELTYADGCVQQVFTDANRDGTQDVETLPPCPMPWLEGCKTLSGFDASAFPMELWYLTEEDLTRVAQELLPEYTFLDGKFSTRAATFLMENPAGEIVFMGGAYAEGRWVWTESTPLPDSTGCDSYHAGAGSMKIYYALPQSPDLPADEQIWIEYVIDLQDDGTWQVVSMLNDMEDWLHFYDGYLFSYFGDVIWGDCTLVRDITKIDWATFPKSITEVLPFISGDRGMVGGVKQPLYASASGDKILWEYYPGTPVTVLDEANGRLQVRIANSDVVGWMSADGLLLGGEQVIVEKVDDSEGFHWAYFYTAKVCAPDALMDTDGDGQDEWYQLLSDQGEMYHVLDTYEYRDLYLPAAECTIKQPYMTGVLGVDPLYPDE